MATADEDRQVGASAPEVELAATARALLQIPGRAALATLQTRDEGPGSGRAAWPYVSLVLVAHRRTAASIVPLFLLSDLAQHTRNLRSDRRLSLLIEDADGSGDPLASPRLTLLGRAAPSNDPDDRRCFVEQHPSSELYAEFSDFSVWRMEWERAHLVAGFGRIRWMTEAEIFSG